MVQTDRLLLRLLTQDDADFMLELLNSKGWIENIGDRGVRNLADSQKYLNEKLIGPYKVHGHPFWAVCLKGVARPIGVCGFIKRDFLEHADLGYALLPEHMGKGYAMEAGKASLKFGKDVLNYQEVLGITSPHNIASNRILEKLGFHLEGLIDVPGDKKEKVNLYRLSSI